MLVREAEKGWAGAGWVGFTLTLRDEGALGPGLTPPGVHLRKGPVGGQSHSDNGPAKDH